MKPCTLMMPDKLADYFEAHPLDDGNAMLAYTMMLSPLMFQGKLTRMVIARLMGLNEDAVNAIYDYYQLPQRYGRVEDYALEDLQTMRLWHGEEQPDVPMPSERGLFKDIVAVLTVKQIQERIVPVCKRYRLKAVYLFGSYARGEAREDSDVNLYVRYGRNSKRTGLFSEGDLRLELIAALKKPVSLLTDIPNTHTWKIVAENIRRELTLIYKDKEGTADE